MNLTKSTDKTEDMNVKHLLIILTLVWGSFANAEPELAPESIVHLGKGPYYTNRAIVVDKAQRSVTVWEQAESGFKKLKTYEADFGKSTGDKKFLGDHKTPEGIYHFLGELPKALLNFREYGSHEVRAFPMNYPNLFDKREGKTGSGIWLHGVPENTPLSRGSRGCVTLTKENMNDISQFISLNNTPIIVHDQVTYVPMNANFDNRDKVVAWIRKWLESWQNKNVEQYMSFYSPQFRSRGMNYAQWENYKKGLTENYDQIKVSVSEPRILKFKDEWIIEFIQKYESDKYTDFGKKILYVKGSADDFKIIAEDFDVTTATTAIAQFDSSHFSCCEELKSLTTTKN